MMKMKMGSLFQMKKRINRATKQSLTLSVLSRARTGINGRDRDIMNDTTFAGDSELKSCLLYTSPSPRD